MTHRVWGFISLPFLDNCNWFINLNNESIFPLGSIFVSVRLPYSCSALGLLSSTLEVCPASLSNTLPWLALRDDMYRRTCSYCSIDWLKPPDILNGCFLHLRQRTGWRWPRPLGVLSAPERYEIELFFCTTTLLLLMDNVSNVIYLCFPPECCVNPREEGVSQDCPGRCAGQC